MILLSVVGVEENQLARGVANVVAVASLVATNSLWITPIKDVFGA